MILAFKNTAILPPVAPLMTVFIMIFEGPFSLVVNIEPVLPPLKNNQHTHRMKVPITMKGTLWGEKS